MFSAAFPLAPFIAMVLNFLEIKGEMNAYEAYMRRPIAKGAKGIGAWLGILEFLSIVSVIVNASIVFFCSSEWQDRVSDWTDESKLLLIVGAEHVLIALKIFFSVTIKDTPAWIVKSERERDFFRQAILFQVTKTHQENTDKGLNFGIELTNAEQRVQEQEEEEKLAAAKAQEEEEERQEITQILKNKRRKKARQKKNDKERLDIK